MPVFGRLWPRRVAIIGLGLIGGSLAWAIRDRRPEIEVVGFDRAPRTREQARRRGAVSGCPRRWEEAVEGADLVLLAVPVSEIVKFLPRLPPFLGEDAVVSDTGSTKRRICSLARRVLPERFVGGHPMTGSERTGFEAARGDLLEGRPYVLTPPKGGSDALSVRRLEGFLRTLGARVRRMSPEHHDRVVARISHLPQLLSIALAARLFRHAREDGAFRELLAGGASDWLRTAVSPYGIWKDIFATNVDEVRDALAELKEELDALFPEGEPLGDLRSAFQQAGLFAMEHRREGSTGPAIRLGGGGTSGRV